MNAHRAILADPFKGTVTEVEINMWQDISELIGCRTFTIAGEDEKGNAIYADDEGLYQSPLYFSLVPSFYPEPLAGKLLFLGTDEEGESADVTLTVEEVKKIVLFLPHGC